MAARTTSILVSFLLLATCCLFVTCSAGKLLNKKPIVIVPGVMGSQLEAKLHKTKSGHFYCRRTYEKWYRLWLNMDDLVPFAQNCFKENIKFVFK
jgi:lysophospholipase-3